MGNFKTYAQVLLVLIAFAFVAGCAATDSAMSAMGMGGVEEGERISESDYKSVEVGMTQGDVEGILGEPDSVAVGEENSAETWLYQYLKIPHFGDKVQQDTLVHFDESDRVTGTEMSEQEPDSQEVLEGNTMSGAFESAGSAAAAAGAASALSGSSNSSAESAARDIATQSGATSQSGSFIETAMNLLTFWN